MKKYIIIALLVLACLCSCNADVTNTPNPPQDETTIPETEVPLYNIDSSIVAKWIDVRTETIIEYTDSGYYYEYVNESHTEIETRFFTQNGKIYYYLEGDEPDMNTGIAYEFKDGHLIIAGELEYKPMDIKTSLEEME